MGVPYDISCDNHLGQLMLEKLKQHQDSICQIDAATGEEETYASVASRSIQLARALRRFGLNPGDVLALGGKNHIDLHIPFYAALYNGLPIVGVDPFYKYDEVRTLFKLTQPKIAFCQYESLDTYSKAAADLGLDIKIVTFEHGECTMAKFIDKYDTEEPEEDFRVTDFDTDKVYAFLVSTSGTTGKVKVAAFNHKPFIHKIKGLLKLYNYDKQPKKRVLNLSPVNWISNYFMSVGGPLFGDTKLQSSISEDYDHIVYIINQYKPVTCLMGPSLVTYLVSRKGDVDLSCFKSVTITGSKIFPELLAKFKAILGKDTLAVEAYGQTETIGSVLGPIPNGPSGSCGRPLPIYAIKLVDPNTGAEIKEPYVTGELWNKGPRFTEYYNDPEETALAFSEDGFFKTGDLLYRDENDNYFYVDRIKTLIKYRNSHILPLEVEELISTHPGVKEVCVVGINDPLEGQKAVACIVRNEECHVTAQDIKDLVASKLSKNKELRGGVVFLDHLPLTSSGKLARSKVLQLVTGMKRE
ncbi:luciferin 4-monooxygenase-like [Maniola jurtina]|uniref:luciferin 4-monooxygenase-like n=1 Tax=Maniola jurtina TaxID=191418 RepID=UPI001E68B827|nr:luciferin 4-monooxygenase-like [Maniola jurtina]